MDPFFWKCPFCNRDQTVNERNYSSNQATLPTTDISLQGAVAIWASSITCSNPECRKIELKATLNNYVYNTHGGISLRQDIYSWDLLPESHAKPQPEFIPLVLRQDYYEACKISKLSPKASATLSRRCVQGMIRDFCKISKDRLIDEIRELKKLTDEGKLPPGVTIETVDAIDHIRTIGNIGAHFEKDINVIVDVDEGESQTLIELIEMLFEDWYVASEQRNKRLARIQAISEKKQADKKPNKAVEV